MEHGEALENEVRTSWQPIRRQLLVISSAIMSNFLLGMAYGLPTVMIPQIRRDANSTEAISEEMASWLYSVIGYSSMPWVVIICVSGARIGRKIPFGFVCIATFACFSLMYFSTNLSQILIAQIMIGVSQACSISLNIIIVLEYASPKYRGIFIAIKSANLYWGVWVSNAIGTFCNWKYVPLLGIFLSVYCIAITGIFWPESPQWLASKGKYRKCREQYRWLRGTDIQSEKELEDLIQSQIDYRKTREQSSSYLRSALRTIRSKSFYKPMLLTTLLMVQYVFTGKLVFAVYAIEIIKKMTDSESTAYIGMLILDAITIVALYTGCLLSKFLNRRTLLFFGGFIGITFLFIISLYLYLTELGVIIENKIVSIVLLTLVSIFIGCGPMILLTPIAGEVIPLRYKSSITLIYSFAFLFFTSTALKLFPIICLAFRLSGTFLLYAIVSFLCCITLYKYLPETKDKTLQEIENIFILKDTAKQSSELLPVNK